MTYSKWHKLLNHFQNYHDIKVKGVTYDELRSAQTENDEWLP